MEWLTRKLFEKFKDKYSFIKPLNVVYSRAQKICTITILYPENVSLTEDEKNEITTFIKEVLKLNATLIIKFKKSYLDDEFIKKSLFLFFNSSYPSILGFLDAKSIKIDKKFNLISIFLKLDEEFLKYINEEQIKKDAKIYLEKNFCCEFSIEIAKGTIAKTPKETVLPVLKSPTPRYQVEIVAEMFGGGISPNPEYIKNITSNKKSVILAGKVESLQKKSYEAKKGKMKGQTKYYYSLVVNDTTSKIEARHFATKLSEKKMDSLKDGNSILILGDVEYNGSFRTLYIKALSLCNLPEKIELKQSISNGYEVVNIEPYSIIFQDNIFKVAQNYKNEILQNKYVVFDVETTGLNYEEDELLEIGAVKIENGRITHKFSSLIKPSKPIPPSASLINNITDEMVANSPKVEPVIRDFYRFSRGAILVGYNVSFDQKFILQAAKKQGLLFDNDFLDLMPIAKNKLRLTRYKLIDVVKRLEITLDGAHRAYADALATAEAFLKLNSNEFI